MNGPLRRWEGDKSKNDDEQIQGDEDEGSLNSACNNLCRKNDVSKGTSRAAAGIEQLQGNEMPRLLVARRRRSISKF